MRRSGMVWLTSVIAFFATVAIIIATGPDSNLNNSSVQARSSGVELPQISTYAQDYEASLYSSLGYGSSTNSASATQDSPSVAPPQDASVDQNARSFGTQSSISPPQSASQPEPTAQAQSVAGISYRPREVVSLAHPSNYGERYTRDVSGNLVDNAYIVVLHETVGSASSALNTFQTNHPRDEDQVSYHTLIGLDGTIYYVVPPEQRAFGAGNSGFQSFQGEEAVFTNAEFPSSVNNFAYHISLETPPDGQNSDATYHSGYTEAQYQSLAWLLARTNIPDDRITTHRDVDRSGSRIDPRSFEADRMYQILRRYPNR